MKMKALLLATWLTASSVVLLEAQHSRKDMADDYFAMYEYSRAIPVYEELASFSMKKNKSVDFHSIRRAALSNKMMGDFKRSAYWYDKLFNRTTPTLDDYVNYISVLHILGDYDQAQHWINEAYRYNPGNAFLSMYANQPGYYRLLMADSLRYEIVAEGMNTAYDDFCPTPYEDGVVFASQRRNRGFVNRKFAWDGSNFMDLYFVKKDRDGVLGNRVTPFEGEFNTKFHDGPVAFNADYTMAFISRNNQNRKSVRKNKNVVNVKLYISTRDKGGKWSDPVEFPYNSASYSLGHATMAPDGKTLYFASDMPGGYGQSDIWKSVLEHGAWSKPENLGPAINTGGNELFPYITSKGKLYFSSTGHLGLGGLDIMVAYTEDGAQVVENMGYSLNSSYDDFGIVVDTSGVHGYFSSNRPLDKDLTDNIYRVNIREAVFDLKGTVVENTGSKAPVPMAWVTIRNMNTGVVDSLSTDQQGRFSVRLKKRSNYQILAGKKYFTTLNTDSVSTIGKVISETFQTELRLERQWIKIKAKVIDTDTRRILPGATVVMKDKLTGTTYNYVADDSGFVRIQADPDAAYTFSIRQTNYMDGRDSLTTRNVPIFSQLNRVFALKKMPEVNDVFVLNNIYYDYGKADLREESKVELDKLYDYLMRNPGVRIELSSHTDSRSSYQYNLLLSQQRAQSCVNYLLSLGIEKKRIRAKGYSWSRLVNQCKPGVECSEEEHQMNRRTEVKILSVY